MEEVMEMIDLKSLPNRDIVAGADWAVLFPLNTIQFTIREDMSHLPQLWGFVES